MVRFSWKYLNNAPLHACTYSVYLRIVSGNNYLCVQYTAIIYSVLSLSSYRIKDKVDNHE